MQGCLLRASPKDTLALTKLAAEAQSPMRLVEILVDVNDKRKITMVAKIIAACSGSIAGKRIAMLGLTYKPKTDDMRDAEPRHCPRASGGGSGGGGL